MKETKQMPSILIIDDVRTEQEIIKKTLAPLGLTFLVAENAAAGLEIAAREKPALIVLDVIMPGMGGFKACRELKKQDATKSFPIIMCTTKDGDSDRFWAERQGADAYVPKPFDAEALRAAAKRLL